MPSMPRCAIRPAVDHVAVDVFATEGAAFASPLASNPNTTLSPHVAGMTWNAMKVSSERRE